MDYEPEPIQFESIALDNVNNNDIVNTELTTVLGGIEERPTTIVDYEGNRRVLGGNTTLGLKRSVIEDNLYAQEGAAKAKKEKAPLSIDESIKELVQRYGLKRDYNRALNTLYNRLHPDDIMTPHDERALKLSIADKLRNSNVGSSIKFSQMRYPAAPKDIESLDLNSALDLEKNLYDHMCRIEDYYTAVTQKIYEILREIKT